MKLIKLKCEGCGASLEVNEELKKVHCNYCGTEFIVDDGSTKHTYRKIDEARLKEAEVSEKIRLKELELEERKMLSKEKIKSIKIKILMFLGAVALIDFIFGDGSLAFGLLFIGAWVWLISLASNSDKK